MYIYGEIRNKVIECLSDTIGHEVCRINWALLLDGKTCIQQLMMIKAAKNVKSKSNAIFLNLIIFEQ